MAGIYMVKKVFRYTCIKIGTAAIAALAVCAPALPAMAEAAPVNQDNSAHEQQAPDSLHVVSEDIYVGAGYIEDDVHADGKISDSEENKTIFSEMDPVLLDVKGATPAIGDKFVIYSDETEIDHPVTGKKLGKMVNVHAIAKVIRTDSGVVEAKIINTYGEPVVRGDKLRRLGTVTVPTIDPDSPVKAKNLSGHIAAIRYNLNNATKQDVVYIDLGKSSGVEPGDNFEVIQGSSEQFLRGKENKKRGEVIGRIVVLNVHGNTSSAVIKSSSDSIIAGDKIQFLQKR